MADRVRVGDSIAYAPNREVGLVALAAAHNEDEIEITQSIAEDALRNEFFSEMFVIRYRFMRVW